MDTLREMLDLALEHGGPHTPYEGAEIAVRWHRATGARRKTATPSDKSFAENLRNAAQGVRADVEIFIDHDNEDQSRVSEELRSAAYTLEKYSWILSGESIERSSEEA